MKYNHQLVEGEHSLILFFLIFLQYCCMYSLMTIQFDFIWFKYWWYRCWLVFQTQSWPSWITEQNFPALTVAPTCVPCILTLLLYLWRGLCLCPKSHPPLTWIQMLPQQSCLWATLASLLCLWASDVTHLENREMIQNSLKGKCMCPSNK